MANDPQAPATKDDILLLMEQMGSYYDRIERRLVEVDERIEASEERVKRHFDLTVETIRHDLLGANRDRIEDHEDRLARLEHNAGLRAA